MTEPERSTGSNGGRRTKRFLSPSQKYEIWLALVRGEVSTVQAADRAGVDRSTVVKLRQVGKQGALDAFAASRPGVRHGGPDPELQAARAEISRLSQALTRDGRPVDVGRGKRALGLSGRVPRRVDAAIKHELLSLIDKAAADGWEHRRTCAYLELDQGRAWRWRRRRDQGCLDDRKPGAAVHGLTPAEETAILQLFDEWGDVDRSHKKLAHRGSYTNEVWVSPATVRRVLAAHGLHLKRPRRVRSERRPFPEWADYRKNSLWIYDVTHFAGCPKHAVFAVMDLVTRKWITELVSIEETSTQVQVVFIDALQIEGLLELVAARQDAPRADPLSSGSQPELRPILLAVSDNGPQMTSGSTREFMAMCAIAQHFGRPGTPTDQAWIESLFSHLKAEWPHLDRIRDPDVLRAELADVRHQYNTTRLHAGIGYVTPQDEHQGRGPKIRGARKRGLRQARWARIAYHRIQHTKANRRSPTNVD